MDKIVKMKLTIRIISTIAIITLLSGCFNKELRGWIRKSGDNTTYLIIEEDCGAGNKIFIDGKEWPFKIGQMGKISPGKHTLICGGELSIEIKEGTVFHFDYWGP